MRIKTIPNWVPLTSQQQTVFDVIYSEPFRLVEYRQLFIALHKALPKLTKPRLSDLLRALETKELVCRVNPPATWAVTEEAFDRLSKQAKLRAKIRKGELDE